VTDGARVEVEVVDDVAAAFADLVVREQPRSIAVSGGGTARACYEALAARGGVDWSRVEVLVGDERWVPVDHDDSNEGMARAELLDHVPVAAVHSMRGAGDTPEEAAAAYDGLLRRLGAVDLVHLGMGPDGHTASIFPGSPTLEEAERLVAAAEPGLEPHHRRVTLTLPGIATARHAVFTVEVDDAKADVLRRVLAGDGSLPAARVRAGRVTWLVDRSVST
jgi:6-phosphogluconolactonase